MGHEIEVVIALPLGGCEVTPIREQGETAKTPHTTYPILLSAFIVTSIPI